MSVGVDDTFRELCRRRDWKCTAQRRAVYAYLSGNRCHPTAEMAWRHVRQKLPDVSLDSVYRILKEFADAGVVKRLDSGDAMRFDPDTGEHDHFTCIRCGRVFDFAFLDAEGARRACAGFGKAVSVELQIRGICRECDGTPGAH